MSATGGVVGCTIVAMNYLAYARVLAAGWRRHHQGLPFHVLVIDDPGGAFVQEGVRVLAAEELGLPAGELAQLRGIYGVAELSTALKPHLLRTLLDQGADFAIFLDADTDVHAGVEHVGDLAERHGVVLSAHFLEPPPFDGWSPTEPEIAWSGLFNSGFLAVSGSSLPFLDWWASRLRRDCLFCESAGMHADQKWLDFVPSYFEHHVLRDRGINVAQWNVHERRVEYEGGAFTAGGAPLRTFHFSGFDPDAAPRPGPDQWAKPLRFQMSAEPALERLCREYGAKLFAAGHRELRELPYLYGSAASGRPLGAWERHAYREMLIAAEGRGDVEIPHPFDRERAAEFERILDDPGRTGLLSDAARARLRDARLAGPFARGGRLDRARLAVGLLRQVPRRMPGRRVPWMPHPLTSDRTRLEYGIGSPTATIRQGGFA
jgi:hypothetical protein